MLNNLIVNCDIEFVKTDLVKINKISTYATSKM